MKRVLVISTSPRGRSNSDLLAAAFAEGARRAGHDVTEVSLKGKQIGFCRGCLACQKTGRCVIDDDARAICDAAREADVLVFASPVYYYSISGQLKTFLDRLNPLFSADYRFREVYFLSSAAEDSEEARDYPRVAVRGWTDCFERARLAGCVFCGGVSAPGEAAGRPEIADARAMGEAL